MRTHLPNAAYGVLDYASYPIGMLLAAPVVLRRLGLAEYGIWMFATAVISAGGIIASGFCDVNIQRVAQLRGTTDTAGMVHTVRGMLSINLALGITLAVCAWIAAPYAAHQITANTHTALSASCLTCLRIASVSIFIRALDTVSVSTQHAFEQYRQTVRISTTVRLLTLGSAVVLTLFGGHVVSILWATSVLLAGGAYFQLNRALELLEIKALWPSLEVREVRDLLKSGLFVWLQSIGSVIFAQLDKIVLGLSLGAVAIAPYSICLQFVHPIHGLAASGLHFLFPHLSKRTGAVSATTLHRTVLKAFGCNLALVTGAASLLLWVGNRLIRVWAGPGVAATTAGILPLMIAGAAMMGLSVTGTYAMQALGRFRLIACINIGGRIACLFLMIYLLRHLGIYGLAISRIFYGFVALLVYLPLIHNLTANHLLAFGTSDNKLEARLRP